ncbi:MAG TPA: Xaa-Pro peptidase family protein [Bryobacteraceae bacterium]|jgi:Xaa-Pro aminopeptidase|nr:Xaa-Pro peptidase family protein [Bryobacteraceae bacterium]
MTAEETRRERAASLLGEAKLDALLVTNLHNVRYLTGFTGSNGAVLLFRDGRAVLFTDPRYTVQSQQQVNCRVVIAKGPLTKSILQEIGRTRAARVGFEQDNLTVAQMEGFRKDLPPRTQLKPMTGMIERLRLIKDAVEIEKIRASIISNSGALEAALKRFRIGMKESELAAEIDYQNRKLGAESPSFDTIVAAGDHAALPHAQPGASKIQPGILLIDMGAFRDGYASDMTRMVHVGPATPKYKRAYRAVLEAQLAAVDAVKPGATTHAVDRAARSILKRHGLEKEFIHSTGHGLGLEIHEMPRIGRKDKTKLEAGMAITIEPGVYIEGWGGIRIEDTVLVTPSGCEVLTPTSKELRSI